MNIFNRFKQKHKLGCGLDIGISKFTTFSDGYVVLNPIFKYHLDVSTMTIDEFKPYREEAYQECFTHILRYKPPYITIENIDFSGDNIPYDIKFKAMYLDFALFFCRLHVLCDAEGIELRQLHRYEKSSKICHECGSINENLKLSDRTFNCACGYTCDRDLNAAKVIRDKSPKHYRIL